MVVADPTLSDASRVQLRATTLSSTYAFAKFVCGFHDLSPELHGMMARWIEGPSKLKLGMAPRGHLKTSLWTLADSLRRVTADPNLRLLIVNETEKNTQKWIQQMQGVVVSPLYRFLFPEVVPDTTKVRWNMSQMELVRQANWPEPTIEGMGVGAASTSNHFDRIRNDDIVGRDARESPSVMEKAIDHRKLCWSLLVNPDKSAIDDVCTRWHPKDAADWALRHVKGLDILHLRVWDQEKRPLWPERFTPDVIDQVRVEQGAEMFGLQYLNESVGEGISEFDPKLVRSFSFDYQESEIFLVLERPSGPRRVRLSDCSVFQVIDAGLSPESHDARTANVTIALTPPTESEPFDLVVLEAKATRSAPPEVLSEAHSSYERWQPMFAAIEVFGGHVAFYHWALQAYPDMRLVKLKLDTTRSKATRIRQFWGVYLTQKRLYVNPKEAGDLLDELVQWPNGRTVDLLDAAAWTPSVWVPPEPVRTEEDPLAGIPEEFRSRIRRDDEKRDGRAQRTGY